MTYVVVGILTGLQVTTWFGWFIVEIIIHSLNRDASVGSYQQMLSEQSMQIYQYQGVIMGGTLAALHLAASVKTRASRVASFTVQMFGFLAWFWELYFIIPTFYSHSNINNLFCSANVQANGLAQASPGLGLYVPELSVCRLAIAVASFAVIMEAWQGLIVVYSFCQMFIAPRLEDGTRKEVIEEDDAEVATVVAANPAGYEVVNSRVRSYSSFSLILTAFSLLGYAIFMYSMIDVVYHTAFQINFNFSQYGSSNLTQLGDFIISVNFRQLSLTLVFALAASSYAAFRHNRGIQAGALFLTGVTMLQWWSFIIFSGRFLHQYQYSAAVATDGLQTAGYPVLSAQKAMYAGACIILAGETLRFFVLIGRYFAYVPVTRNNVIPTYIRGAFATANAIPVMLFWFEVAVTLAWWVLQFVDESMSGIFWDVPGSVGSNAYPQYVPIQNVVSETLFIWQTMYLLAVFLPELFSERTKTLASKQAALSVNIVIMSAYFLLSWPWAYAGSHKNGGYWESGQIYPVLPTVFPGGITIVGFCNQASQNTGHDICYLMQGASILSFISGLGYVLLAIWQLVRILTILPTPGQVATMDGTVVDALPPTVPIQKALGWQSALLLIGLLIWALTAIDAGSGYYGWLAWTFGQLPSSPGWQDPALSPLSLTSTWQTILSYTYSVAFGDIVIIGFTVWAASEMAANPVVANWHAWRTLVTGLSGLLFSFFLPQFILVCRFVNWGGLGKIGQGIAAGFIIMCIGDFLLYICALSAQRSPLIALPAAINNTSQPVQQGKFNNEQRMNEVVVDTTKPGNPVVGNTAGQANPAYGNQYASGTEPTVTTAEPVPTRDYSGNQRVPT